MSSDAEILEELRKIRELLTPPATPSTPRGLWPEFKSFLSQYKVLGLAVAFILGVYMGQLVQGLVNDLIMPVISLATGSAGPTEVCPGGTVAVPAWQCITVGPFLVGQFLGTLLTFLIVAGVIFLLVKVTNRYNIR